MAKDPPRPGLVRQTDFAATIGKSRQYVSKKVKDGTIPFEADAAGVKWIDPRAGKVALENSRVRPEDIPDDDPDQDPIPQEAQADNSLTTARLDRERTVGEIQRLKLRKMAGELAEVDQVEREIRRVFGSLREKLNSFPSRVAGKLVSKKTERDIAVIIEDEIRRLLSDFADEVEDMRFGDAD